MWPHVQWSMDCQLVRYLRRTRLEDQGKGGLGWRDVERHGGRHEVHVIFIQLCILH